MARIKFYRGLVEDYDVALHGDGIYFATDKLKILHNGESYGAEQLDLVEIKEFISDNLLGYVKDLDYSEETGEFSYSKKVKVTTTETTETGEVIVNTYYKDEPVTFSIRNLALNSIKNLEFAHNDKGEGQLTYSIVSETTRESDSGSLITELTEESKSIVIPESSYSDVVENGLTTRKYFNGLMTGSEKETLEMVTGEVEEINSAISWNSTDPK